MLCTISKRVPTFAAFAAITLSNSQAWSSPQRISEFNRRGISSESMPSLIVAQFPCLGDNYGFLIHDETTGHTAAIDTPCAATYKAELQKRGWTLTHILNTHHHHDHTGGNMNLKAISNNVQVYGPAKEKDRIPGIDVAVDGGDMLTFGSFHAKVMDVGGHTRGHIAYHFEDDHKVFCGDALFALGCGRMFEGTPDQFWSSLQALRNLPDETLVYCAHEYTESNAKFALTVEPGNSALVERVQRIMELRKNEEPTVPTTIGMEKQTNPFLRVDVSSEIQSKIGMSLLEGKSAAQAFAKLRSMKDCFRG